MTKKSNDSPALAPQNVELKNRIISIVCELRLKPTQLLDMRNASYVDVEDALGQLIDEGKLVLTSDRYLEPSFKAPALAEPAAPLDQPQDTVAVTHLIGPIVREIYGDTAELGHYKLAISVYRMNESEILRLRGERLMLLGELGKAKIRAEKAEAAAPSKGMDQADFDAQMQHEYAEASKLRKIDWDDWELAWTLGAKFAILAEAAPSSAQAQIPQEFRTKMAQYLGYLIQVHIEDEGQFPDAADFTEMCRAAKDDAPVRASSPSSATEQEIWPVINHERGLLIDKQITGKISPLEAKKLEALNAYADAHLEAITPASSAGTPEGK